MNSSEVGTGTHRTSLSLLGGFLLAVDDEPADVAPSAQRVLALLALRDRPVQRSQVAGMLWLDKRDARARANLRSALWRLSQSGLDVVDSRGNDLSLSATVETDCKAFLEWSDRLIRARPRLSDLDVDLGYMCFELLPDWYDDWVQIERERIRQRWLHAVEALTTELIRVRRYAGAVEAGLTAVAADPLRESAHRAVMLAHLSEGNVSEAKRQYERCTTLLEQDLGVAPSPALEALVGTAS